MPRPAAQSTGDLLPSLSTLAMGSCETNTQNPRGSSALAQQAEDTSVSLVTRTTHVESMVRGVE